MDSLRMSAQRHKQTLNEMMRYSLSSLPRSRPAPALVEEMLQRTLEPQDHAPSFTSHAKAKPPVCSSQTGGSSPSGIMEHNARGFNFKFGSFSPAAGRSAGSDAACAGP